MKALVIYDSMFGNTHAVADEIAAGLQALESVAVRTTESIDASQIADIDLLVVGGPTHMHGVASKASRKAAEETADKDPEVDLDDAAHGPGLRAWFDGLAHGEDRLAVAFDTRADKPAILVGSAAKGIAKRLRKHGYRQLAEPESFFIQESEGPLKPGELERARRWGEQLASLGRSHS